MTEVKSEAVLLEFKAKDFETAKVQYTKKQDVRTKLYNELEALTDVGINPSEDVEKDPLFYYYEWLVVKHHASNTMRLKPPKLVELMEIDLSGLEKAIAEFNAVPNIGKPTKKDFEVYAETPEELARLKLANDIIKVADKFNKECSTFRGVDLDNFKPLLSFSGGFSSDGKLKYIPNTDYIKNPSRYKN